KATGIEVAELVPRREAPEFRRDGHRGHDTHRGSRMTCIAQRRMYRSVSATPKRLTQAQREWCAFSFVANSQSRKRSDFPWKESRYPPIRYRAAWQPDV